MSTETSFDSLIKQYMEVSQELVDVVRKYIENEMAVEGASSHMRLAPLLAQLFRIYGVQQALMKNEELKTHLTRFEVEASEAGGATCSCPPVSPHNPSLRIRNPDCLRHGKR